MNLWITTCMLLLAPMAWGDLLSEGLALFEAGEVAKAHEKLSAHLASHPDDPEALFYLGRTEPDGARAQEIFRMFLAKHPRHFDKTFLALIKASEQTGSLGEMLDRISNYLQKELEMRGKIRAAMAARIP